MLPMWRKSIPSSLTMATSLSQGESEREREKEERERERVKRIKLQTVIKL